MFLEPAVGIKTIIAILKDQNAHVLSYVCPVCVCCEFRKEIFFKGYLKTPNDSFFLFFYILRIEDFVSVHSMFFFGILIHFSSTLVSMRIFIYDT